MGQFQLLCLAQFHEFFYEISSWCPPAKENVTHSEKLSSVILGHLRAIIGLLMRQKLRL